MTGRTPLLPHQIHAYQVTDWLVGSLNQAVTFHRTSQADAEAIIRRGVDVSRSEIGSYGRGFYTTTAPDPFFGEAEIAVAIRLRQPLVGHADQVANLIDDVIEEVEGFRGPITPGVAARIRAHLLRRGHDGIIVRDGGGDGIDYVVALENGSVKVVVP